MSTETVVKERRPAVSGAVVVEAYITGVKAGRTNAQIAESVNMTENAFNVRVSNLRKKYAEDAAAKKAKGETVVNPFDNLPSRSKGKSGNVFDTHKETLEKLAAADAAS